MPNRKMTDSFFDGGAERLILIHLARNLCFVHLTEIVSFTILNKARYYDMFIQLAA